MNRHRLALALAAPLFLTSLACAPSALAATDIVKCVSADGHVTLTDEACQSNERSVTMLAATEEADPALAAPAGVIAAARAPRPRAHPAIVHDTFTRLDPPSRAMARDVLTLKAARQAMQLMDGAASAMRAQRLAGLH